MGRVSLVVAAFGLLALLANGAASLAWQLALRVSSRNSATDTIYVWTVRADLLVLLALLAGIVVLALQAPAATAARKTRGQGFLRQPRVAPGGERRGLSMPGASNEDLGPGGERRGLSMPGASNEDLGRGGERRGVSVPAVGNEDLGRGGGVHGIGVPGLGHEDFGRGGEGQWLGGDSVGRWRWAVAWLGGDAVDRWRWRAAYLWLGGPLVALAGVATWRFGAFNGVLLLVCSLAAMWIGRSLSGVRDGGVWWLLGVGLLLRMATAVGLGLYAQAINGGAIVLDDEQSYDFAARQVARILAWGSGDLDTEWRHLIGHHLDLLGLLYAVREPNFTSIRLIDAALGTLALGLVLGIGVRVWHSKPGAYVAAWLTAVWPLLVLWSATGLRESLALVAALLLPWLLVRYTWRGQPTTAVGLQLVVGGLAAAVLLVARPEAFLALALAALIVGPLALLARRAGAWPVPARLGLCLASMGLVAAGVFVGVSGVIGAIGQPLSPRALEYRAAVAELTPMIEHIHERLPPKPDPEMMNLGTLLRAVPPGRSRLETVIVAGYTSNPLGYQVLVADGTSFVILPEDAQRPTDENVDWRDLMGRFAQGTRLLLLPVTGSENGSGRRLLLFPDALAWDVLLALNLVAARRDWRRIALSPARGLLYAYPWLMVLGLALTSTNVGTVARHRSTLVPWLVLASAPLLLQLWERVRAGVRHAEQPPVLTARPAEGGSASGAVR